MWWGEIAEKNRISLLISEVNDSLFMEEITTTQMAT